MPGVQRLGGGLTEKECMIGGHSVNVLQGDSSSDTLMLIALKHEQSSYK